MTFKSLDHISLTHLCDLFNTAFADYFVNVNMTPDVLKEKIYSEDIDLRFSMGIFDGEKPVGFMLHAIRETDGKKVAYNAGTGVIQEYRGQNATVKMYDKLIPLLLAQGVSEVVLEVIEQNAAAIRSYKKAGFRVVADLACFKGDVKIPDSNAKLEVKELKNLTPENVRPFADWQVTWQHSSATISKMKNLRTFGAYYQGELAGYLIGQASRARVYQFAVAHHLRRKGIGSALFYTFFKEMQSEISVINIDDPSGQSQLFLQNIGLHAYLNQHKMMRIL